MSAHVPMPYAAELYATVRDMGEYEVPVAEVVLTDPVGETLVLDLDDNVSWSLLAQLVTFHSQLRVAAVRGHTPPRTPETTRVAVHTHHPEHYELINHADGTRWVIRDGTWKRAPEEDRS